MDWFLVLVHILSIKHLNWNPWIQVSTNMFNVNKPRHFMPSKLNDFTICSFHYPAVGWRFFKHYLKCHNETLCTCISCSISKARHQMCFSYSMGSFSMFMYLCNCCKPTIAGSMPQYVLSVTTGLRRARSGWATSHSRISCTALNTWSLTGPTVQLVNISRAWCKTIVTCNIK